MKKKPFLITSLLAAGLFPQKSDAAMLGMTSPIKDPRPSLFERFALQHTYTLAAHRSHSSHSSHRSHRSSSGSRYSAPVYRAPTPNYSKPAPLYQAPNRNLDSTPRSSILPSPPAAAQKTLPGNSEKFRKIVAEVQTALQIFGYYAGPIDGYVGADTRLALSKMQADNNLKVTGTVTLEVLDAFRISAN